MRNRRGFLLLLIVTAVLLVVAVLARQRLSSHPVVDGDKVVAGQSYTLTGATSDDLVVWAQAIHLDTGSSVQGDASLIGETIDVDSAVSGDLTAMGSTVTVGSDAAIKGDALLMGSTVMLGGQVDGDLTVTSKKLIIQPDAQLTGDLYSCADHVTDNRAAPPKLLKCADAPGSPALSALSTLGRNGVSMVPGGALGLTAVGLVGSLIVSLILCGLATLAVTIFPRQISRIEEAVRAKPGNLVVSAVVAGLVIVGLGAGLVVLVATVPPLGLILVPIAGILALVFVGASLIGVITLTLVFGDWLLTRLGRGPYPYPPLVTAAVGSVALVLLLHLIALIPYGGLFGLIAFGVLLLFGAGAAFSTRLGTRPNHRSYFVQG
jgi:hypothetical protein